MPSSAFAHPLEFGMTSHRRIERDQLLLCCRRRWTIMSVRTIRCGSSTPSSMGWILRRRGFWWWRRLLLVRSSAALLALLLKLYIYGYPNRVRSSRRLEIGVSSRNIEVLWLLGSFVTGLQNHRAFRRLTIGRARANRSSNLSGFGIRASICTRLRVAGRRRKPHQGGQQQRIATLPALRCESSSAVPTSGGRSTSSGSTRAMSRTARQAAARYEEPGRKDCGGAQREARSLPSDAGPARPVRRGSDHASVP